MTSQEKVISQPIEGVALSETDSALDELLNDNVLTDITEDLDMSPRFQKPWTIKAMTKEEYKELMERATHPVRDPDSKRLIQRVDPEEFMHLIIAYNVTSPDLTDPKVLKKFGIRAGSEEQIAIKVIKLPGLIEKVAAAIMSISGFNENKIEIAKN